jgi:Zn-dependent peptidase ImmA (M78 family)
MNKIKILGSETKIIIDIIQDSENAAAMFIPSQDVILLDKRSDEKFKDFCHELMHLLVHRTKVNQAQSWSNDLEEVLAENFAEMMFDNFKDIQRLYNKFKK